MGRVGDVRGVVGHQQYGNLPPAYKIEHKLPHAYSQFRVQSRKRFVQQQGVWLGQQGSHQGDACALAARQGGGIGIGKSCQLQVVQALRHTRKALRPRTGSQRKQQVFRYRHMGKQQGILKQNSDAPLFGGELVDAASLQADVAVKLQFRRERAADGSQHTRFARSTGPHDGMDHAGPHPQVQVADQGRAGGSQTGYVEVQGHGGMACEPPAPGDNTWARRRALDRLFRPPCFERVRMRMKIKSLFAVALVTLGTAAGAQSTAAKKELVAKVLQLQQPAIEGVARGLAEQPAAIMMQQVRVVMQTRIPPDKRDPIAKDIQADLKKYGDDVLPLMRDRAIKLAPSTIGAMLDERFTEDELKQLIALLESPVNRKYQQMGGEMQKSLSDKLVADAKDTMEPKIKALEQAIAAHLGLPPAPAADNAAPAPARKAPAKPASK